MANRGLGSLENMEDESICNEARSFFDKVSDIAVASGQVQFLLTETIVLFQF